MLADAAVDSRTSSGHLQDFLVRIRASGKMSVQTLDHGAVAGQGQVAGNCGLQRLQPADQVPIVVMTVLGRRRIPPLLSSHQEDDSKQEDHQ